MVLRPLPVVKVQYLAQLPGQFLEKTDPGKKKISIRDINFAFTRKRLGIYYLNSLLTLELILSKL